MKYKTGTKSQIIYSALSVAIESEESWMAGGMDESDDELQASKDSIEDMRKIQQSLPITIRK